MPNIKKPKKRKFKSLMKDLINNQTDKTEKAKLYTDSIKKNTGGGQFNKGNLTKI